MQPIHYLNAMSGFSAEMHKFLGYAFGLEDLPDELYEDILSKLSFIKPLRGTMTRILSTGKSVHFIKNFHDEKEWRYIPNSEELHKCNVEKVIVKQNIIGKKSAINQFLEDDQYSNLWLKFDYKDIKYLIVSNSSDRIDLIKYISSLSKENFSDSLSMDEQKGLLISRILVLDEIKGDW